MNKKDLNPHTIIRIVPGESDETPRDSQSHIAWRFLRTQVDSCNGMHYLNGGKTLVNVFAGILLD